MKEQIVYLALNGVLILIVSLVSGRWFAKAIKSKGNEVAWRVVHSGGSMGGVMLISFSSLIPIIVLSSVLQELLIWSVIIGTWLFLFGMVTAAITGERGLAAGGTLINKSVYYSYILASFLSLAGCGLLVAGLVNAL